MRNANPNSGGSVDGVSIEIFVNDDPTPKFSSGTSHGFDSTLLFNVGLGNLSAGDTIYVAIGPKGSDLFDSIQLRYEIAVVPEPSTLSVVLVAASLGSFLSLNVARRKSSPRKSPPHSLV
jgi:hypothetical protein